MGGVTGYNSKVDLSEGDETESITTALDIGIMDSLVEKLGGGTSISGTFVDSKLSGVSKSSSELAYASVDINCGELSFDNYSFPDKDNVNLSGSSYENCNIENLSLDTGIGEDEQPYSTIGPIDGVYGIVVNDLVIGDCYFRIGDTELRDVVCVDDSYVRLTSSKLTTVGISNSSIPKQEKITILEGELLEGCIISSSFNASFKDIHCENSSISGFKNVSDISINSTNENCYPEYDDNKAYIDFSCEPKE